MCRVLRSVAREVSLGSGGSSNAAYSALILGKHDDTVEEIYSWLDGNSTAIEEMKEVIAESHPDLDVVRKKDLSRAKKHAK